MIDSIRRIYALAIYNMVPVLSQPMQWITIAGYIFLPVIFMALFVKDIGLIHGLIGVLVNSTVISGIFQSQDYVYDRVYFRLQDFLVASPMKNWEYVLAVGLSSYLPTSPALIASLGLLYYVGILTDIYTLLLTLGILALGAIGFVFLGFFLATMTNNPSTVAGMSNILGLVLGFLAPVYYPMDYIPKQIRIYMLALPSTPTPQILRVLYRISNVTFPNLYVLLGSAILWDIVFITLSVKKAFWREK